MLSVEDLERLSIDLRDYENRKHVDSCIIDGILNSIGSESLDYQLAASKVLANYVADVPANAQRISPVIDKIVFNELGYESLILVQLILLANLLTTSLQSFTKVHEIFQKLLQVISITEDQNLQDQTIHILDDLCDISQDNEYTLKISIDDFKILYDSFKGFIDEDDENIGDSVLLKLSARLKEVEGLNDDFLFKFFAYKLETIIDDQILLNVTYSLNQPTLNTIDYTLNLLENISNEHKASLILIISNSMIDKEIRDKVCDALPISFVNDYFKELYFTFTMAKPWEFQSISIFNKIPLSNFDFHEQAIDCFLTNLKVNCNEATLQIRSDVILLQIDIISKLLEACLETQNRVIIDKLIFFLRTLRSYKNDSLQLTILQNYLNFLFKIEFQKYNYDNGELLKYSFESIKFDIKMDTKFLAILSKVLGIYAAKYQGEDWFANVFKKLDTITNSSLDMNDPNIKIFINNLNYTKSIMA